MHAEITSKRDQLLALCVKHRVRTLHLTGSASSGGFDPARSDLDFVVRFQPGPRAGFSDVYFALLHDLKSLFGRPIDLIEEGCVPNKTVAASIEASKVCLYAAA
ncbi:MAG: nucleotidyltransferase family protein [Phycisphaerales bacterium]